MTEGELIPKNEMSREEIDKIVELWTKHDKGPRDYIKVGHNKSSILKTFAMFCVGTCLGSAISALFFIGLYVLLVYLQKG